MKAAPALLLAASLVACGPRSAATPESTLMLAAMGSFDHSADQRLRLADGLRRAAVWTTKPPLTASILKVTYDGDLRTLSWRADLQGSHLSLRALAGGSLRPLGNWQGKSLYRIQDGPLKGNLAAQGGGDLTLMSGAYASHYEPQAARLGGVDQP